MKIESGSQTLQCEPETAAPVQAPPKVCVDRVEQARVEERAFAGEQSGQLAGLLKDVPSPGVLELEVQAKIHHNGGAAKVTAERDASGEFLIRVEAKGVLAIPLPVSSGLGATGGLTYRVRTPEAAADLLQSLAATGLSPTEAFSSEDGAHALHYAAANLERIDLGTNLGANAAFAPAIIATGLEVSQNSTTTLDLNKNLLISEVALEGEAYSRGAMLIAGAGLSGELAIKLRSETKLPAEVISRITSGELSVADAVRESKVTYKIVFEGEERGQVNTLFAAGSAQVKRLEAEVDLTEFLTHPSGHALKGHVTTLVADQRSMSVGVELAGSSAFARGAIYSASKRELFEPHEQLGLQQELDVQRSLPR